jgi:MoaA/NifB/PqqE/SkfB family radical SAM enzyme
MASSKYAVRLKIDESPLWRDRRPQLVSLDIELTERCNCDCIHCCINLPANDAAARGQEMTTSEVKCILREAAQLGVLLVRFTGGEPLLRTDFEELYVFARQQGLKVLLFTNGCLVSPRLADLFARIPPLSPIEITVYGMTRRSYEAVTRAHGSFAQFRRGVGLLLERRIPFVVKSALLPPNRAEMTTFEAWAASLPGMTKPPEYSMFFYSRDRRDNAQKNKLIRSLRLSPAEGVAIQVRDRARYLKNMSQFCGRFLGPPGDRLFPCGFGDGPCVDAQGRVQPCMGIRVPELTYSLRASSPSPGHPDGGGAETRCLADALANFFPRLREMRATNPEYLRRCARCFLKNLCDQCPGASWAEHGTLDTPLDHVCAVAHAHGRELGLLHASESAWEVEDWRERVAQFDRRVGLQG